MSPPLRLRCSHTTPHRSARRWRRPRRLFPSAGFSTPRRLATACTGLRSRQSLLSRLYPSPRRPPLVTPPSLPAPASVRAGRCKSETGANPARRYLAGGELARHLLPRRGQQWPAEQGRDCWWRMLIREGSTGFVSDLYFFRSGRYGGVRR